MKKIVCFLLVVSMLALCGCSAVKDIEDTLTEKIEGNHTVNVILHQQDAENADITPKIFDKTGEVTYHFWEAADDAAQYKIFCMQAEAEDTAVLVVDLRTASYAGKMVAKAKEEDLPVIFCGAMPDSIVMNRYDKCWFIGFDPKLAVERQADILISLFRQEKLTDLDGDFQLSTLAVQTAAGKSFMPFSYAEDLVNKLELGGISVVAAGEPVCGAGEEELLQQLQGLLLPALVTEETDPDNPEEEPEEYWVCPAEQAEIIICGDAAAGSTVLQLQQQLATAQSDPEIAEVATQPSDCYIVCFGETAQITQALQAGRIVGTVVKDLQAVADAVQVYCANIVAQRSPTVDSPYFMTDSKYLMLDYKILK